MQLQPCPRTIVLTSFGTPGGQPSGDPSGKRQGMEPRMALYPTLEDMVVDQYQTMQRENDTATYMISSFPQPSAPIYETRYSANPPPIYESIGEFGTVKGACVYPVLPASFKGAVQPTIPSMQQDTTSIRSSATSTNRDGQIMLKTAPMIAPITSQSTGLLKANITHGVRQVMLAKDENGKYGMRFRSFNKGIFVQFVADGSPAAAAGVRFGDQILKLNDVEVVGMNAEKAMDLMTSAKNPDQLLVTVRDRPFERTITLHKDSNGNLGFTHKENLITAIVKDSSASRNGLLTNHRILEIDGRNVMAFKNKEVKACLIEAPQTVTLTIMPTELYDELIKKMDWSLMKKQDHTVPEIPSM
ncbi:Syntenin-1 [Toxocara canis]|uniref:Syntenin-1 n=1 Tax=Toxocara canis TaxID=6265 RepID=A0A0B2VFP0_TOXCA|nr:Syntenin-1 [Toxocara canis]